MRHLQSGGLAEVAGIQGEWWAARPARADLPVIPPTRAYLEIAPVFGAFFAASVVPASPWVPAPHPPDGRGPRRSRARSTRICTTNTTWSATIRMTDALVDGLGSEAPDGRRAFPGPAALAAAPDGFYEAVARTGYRGSYIRGLATSVAEGRVDLEALADPGLPGAHVMLTSLGRYRRLVLDSATRPRYARLRGRAASDAEIEHRFRRHGAYAGLAFWLALTGDRVEDDDR